MRDDTGPRLVQPTIPATANSELKGHILALLKEIPFTGKDHEDAYKHLDEVNDVGDYFNVPNVPRETQLLRMLLVTLKGAGKDWLKSLPPGTITTWAQLKEEFIDQFCPPSKISKLKKAIANFEQQAGESLYEAWERYKSLLRNCPHHDLNNQQEVSIFYDGVNITTRQLLDSQGPLTKKAPPVIKQLIEEFSKHSREYHNPRNDVTRGSAYAASEDLSAVMAMLKNMDRRMHKMDQAIHAIRVGCENYNGPHLTRDCDLDENGNKKVQVCYSSGDRYDEDWRKPKKEWLPYEEYKKAKEEKYRQKGRGFYQKEDLTQERKPSLEEMLTKFVAASEKRHSDHDGAIQETRTMLRNQQASIHNIETQLGQLAQQINQRSLGELPSKTENNPGGAHINILTTRSGKIITPLAPIQNEAPKELQKEDAETQDQNQNLQSAEPTRRVQNMDSTSPLPNLKEQIPKKPFQPPLPYLARVKREK
ncbi:uncharacterized protein LOC128132285 [Lactuca sativa]|uniref:uncharacterized protein LOC128132285 n=1 Tax=Lactuca sativa TaxID=4236 RepID=UPI0022AEE429|nr:uncharacterized protein LOC128132285 [Lactuca sativa]